MSHLSPIFVTLLLLAGCGSGSSNPQDTNQDNNQAAEQTDNGANAPVIPLTENEANTSNGEAEDSATENGNPLVNGNPGQTSDQESSDQQGDNDSQNDTQDDNQQDSDDQFEFEGEQTGDFPGDLTDDNSADANQDEDDADQNTVDQGEQDNPDNQIVTPGTSEISPTELLLNEIKLIAGTPILEINNLLSSGQFLSEEQNGCLGSFDPAIGEALTFFDCTNGTSPAVTLFDSKLFIRRATLVNTAECQASLAAGTLANCELELADITVPTRWVANPNSPPSQIGSVQPIAGAKLKYNLDGDNILSLQHHSDITGAFICSVDLATASVLSTAPNIGNCRSEIDRITRQLYGFRVE